jgi:hypothetical protein
MRVWRRWLVATLSVLLLTAASIAVTVPWRRFAFRDFAVRYQGRDGIGSYVILVGEPHDDLFSLISGNGLHLVPSDGPSGRFEETVADGYFRFRDGVECDVGVSRFHPHGPPPGASYRLSPDEDARAGRGEVAVLRLTAICGGT